MNLCELGPVWAVSLTRNPLGLLGHTTPLQPEVRGPGVRETGVDLCDFKLDMGQQCDEACSRM